MKMRPDESWEGGVVHRLLEQELELSKAWQHQNLFIHKDSYDTWTEETLSAGYPGVLTLYMLHEVRVEVKTEPSKLFLVLGLPDMNDFTTTSKTGMQKMVHHYSWRPVGDPFGDDSKSPAVSSR